MKTKYPILQFVDTMESISIIPEKISEGIRRTVVDFTERFKNLDEVRASQKKGPEAWSQKEVLGHLIDSASNNHQRFVRIQYLKSRDFLAYDQNEWVKRQKYESRTWKELLLFWESYNFHLAHIINYLPLECLQISCTIGSNEPLTIGYIVVDYLGHMQHHLQQIERM
jgi:hypothetical protein